MSRGTLDPALLTRLSLTGLSPSLAGFPKTILLNLSDQLRGPNPGMHAFRFGLFRFRSPLLTESLVVFSSSGYLDVSVHRVPLHTLWIGVWMTEGSSAGFPHSDISGGRERNIDSGSSGERNRKSPNRGACTAGFGLHLRFRIASGMALGKPAREGESPVHESLRD